MKCTIPEISWHNREPVLSVDIHPVVEKFYRLATGGADCHVLIWQLNICDNGAVKMEALSDLTRHQRAVNAVRWSPEGQFLATADDDANIIIWQLKTDNIPLLEGESNNDKEIWIVHKVMRGHKEDIYDLCWSPNGQKLLSGSIDNTAILWDFTKGKSDTILSDHKGFVQGVTWDPKSQYIATISTDRVCRIFEASGKQVKARIQKGLLPVPEAHYLYNKEVKFFHDDTFKSFFRRLDFSPDGTLLAVPSGRVEIEDCKKILHATYIFAVDCWSGPIAIFPSGKQCSTVVRFCPILFELQEEGPDAIISLPFRMILAIGTDHDIILYDTQQTAPFAYFKDIHYTRLTDLTWSKDGRLLIASSTDGFCALITFDINELGVPYTKEESEVEDVMNMSGCEEILDDENADVCKQKIEVATKPKKPNLLEKWTIKTPKRRKSRDDVNNQSANEENNDKVDVDNTNKRKLEDKNDATPIKRIKPIPVQDKKVNDENVCEKKDTDAKLINVKRQEKVSPLLSFLKGEFKHKKNDETKNSKTTPLKIVDLTLDELEARDAFPNEKSEDKSSTGDKKEMDIDEYTEEFSLHLENTTNTTEISEKNDKNNVNKDSPNQKEETEAKTNENCVQSTTSNDDIEVHDINKEQNTIIKDKNNTPEQKKENESSKELKTESCGEIINGTSKNNTEDCPESKKLSTKAQVETSENKTVTKRRIPLITLSSPKHKKK